MKLTQKQYEHACSKLVEKQAKCPACQSVELGVGMLVVALPEFERGGGIVRGSSAPFIPVTCMHCFHVSLFSAVLAGVPVDERHATN
jgi:hypothetical protein